MTSRTHDIWALTSLVVVAVNFPLGNLNIPTVTVSLIGNIIGALIPDMDQASNRLWDLLPGGNFLGRILKNIFLSHRTISHSLLGVFLIYKFLIWFLPKVLNPNFINVQIVAVAIMVGFISHLVADFFTEEGLPLFFPIKLKLGFPPFKHLRITTGSWFEKFVVFPGLLVFLIWFALDNQGKLLNMVRLITR